MPAKVVVACASGMVTSHIVAGRINALFVGAGIDAVAVAVDRLRMENELQDAAAFVPILREPPREDVPTFNGSAFLSGVGQEAEFRRLVAALDADEPRG